MVVGVTSSLPGGDEDDIGEAVKSVKTQRVGSVQVVHSHTLPAGAGNALRSLQHWTDVQSALLERGVDRPMNHIVELMEKSCWYSSEACVYVPPWRRCISCTRDSLFFFLLPL